MIKVPRGSRNSKPPGSSEPSSGDPFSQLAIEAETGSERESGKSEGGLIRNNPVERFDPDGCKSPDGEWKSDRGESSAVGNGQRAVTEKLPEHVGEAGVIAAVTVPTTAFAVLFV